MEAISIPRFIETTERFIKSLKDQEEIYPQYWLNPDIEIETIEVKEDD